MMLAIIHVRLSMKDIANISSAGTGAMYKNAPRMAMHIHMRRNISRGERVSAFFIVFLQYLSSCLTVFPARRISYWGYG